MNLEVLGRFLIVAGIAAILIGALIVSGKWPTFLGRLPGNVRIERPNFNFYFPIVTCLLLSALATAVFWILSRFR